MPELTSEVGGHSVRAWVEGKGKPLLFFYDQWHASPGLSPLVEELRYRFRVHAVNPPGFGGSSLAEESSMTTKEYAAFLGEALGTVTGGRAIMVLHDIGLPIGLEALAEGYAPLDRLDGVVLSNGPLYEDQVPSSLSPRMSPFLRLRDLPTDRIAHRRRLLKLYGSPEQLDEALAATCWERYIQGYLRSQTRLGQSLEESLAVSRQRLSKLAESGIPVLVLWGEVDPLGGKDIAQRIGEDLPEAEGFLLPGVGHFPHVEAPKVMADEILAFLSRTRPTPPSSTVPFPVQ